MKKPMAAPVANLPLPLERNLFFYSQVNQDTILNLTKSIIQIQDDDDRLERMYDCQGIDYDPPAIKIYIDSYGGQVYQCFGLLSIIETSKTPIHTIVTGCAMSCGFMILITGHKRFAFSRSTVLYHQLSSAAIGMMKEMEMRVEQSRKLQDDIEELVLEKTKIKKERLEQSYKEKEDWFMSAEEAKKLGVVDKIIKPNEKV